MLRWLALNFGRQKAAAGLPGQSTCCARRLRPTPSRTRPGPLGALAEPRPLPCAPPPRSTFLGSLAAQRAWGVAESWRSLLFRGWGTRAARTRMLAKPAVSRAPTGPGPGPGGEMGWGGREGDLGGSCSPFFPGHWHHPLQAASPFSAASAGKEQGTSGCAGFQEKPPAPPSSEPRGSAPSAASFPRGEGTAASPGGASSEKR